MIDLFLLCFYLSMVVTLGDGEQPYTVAPVMTCTLSCDHRVVDGAVGAQYLQAFKTIVENPLALLL